jgi:hypothetical protein
MRFLRRLWREVSDSRIKLVFGRVASRISSLPTAAVIDDTLLPFDLPAVRREKLTVDFDGGTQSSDAGLLAMREAA